MSRRRGPERYVGRREMAEILGVGLTTLDRFVSEGMPSETWGIRTRRFLPSEAKRWARDRAQEAERENEVPASTTASDTGRRR